MKKLLLILLSQMLMLILITNNSYADWIDDWLDTHVTTNPSSYTSQKYGYYSAGGFSTRVAHRPENLFNISMPSISVGCGGIDTFWGGISFMNADYLVKKAEGILKNAPYVIFSLGLKALSTQFGDTIESVQAIVDQLNQLQLDECSAAKGLVQLATGEIPSSLTEEFNRLTSNAENLASGIAKSWNKSKISVDNTANKVKQDTINRKQVKGIAKDIISGKGYLLALLSSNQYQRITVNEANAIRAMVGDVYYNGTNKTDDGNDKEMDITYLTEGCASSVDFKNYTSDTPYLQTAGSKECKRGKISIEEMVANSLSGIQSALTDNTSQPLDDELIKFITKTDIPIFAYMKTAALAGEEFLTSSVDTLTPLVASAYAYYSYNNLSNNLRKVIRILEEELNNQVGYTLQLVGKLREYKKRIDDKMKKFESEYSIATGNFNYKYQLAQSFQKQNEELQKIRSNSFLQGR